MYAKSEKHAKKLASKYFGSEVSSYVKRYNVKCNCGESADITFFPINDDDEREISYTICESCYHQEPQRLVLALLPTLNLINNTKI